MTADFHVYRIYFVREIEMFTQPWIRERYVTEVVALTAADAIAQFRAMNERGYPIHIVYMAPRDPRDVEIPECQECFRDNGRMLIERIAYDDAAAGAATFRCPLCLATFVDAIPVPWPEPA